MSSQSKLPRFKAEAVYDFVNRALIVSGVDEGAANATAKGLWLATLRGVDSHGIRLLPHYLSEIKGGRINPKPVLRFEKTTSSTGRLDADCGLGHFAGITAMHHAIELAEEAGSGHVAVYNSNHCGSMSFFAQEACSKDMIGTAYTHATPTMRSANATTPFFGTNPICMAAPMVTEGPFCYDGATTLVSVNKIRMHGDSDQEIPLGWGANKSGQETTIAKEVTQLLPIGGYKGFGLAMMVDIFCSMLTGAPSGDQISKMFDNPSPEKRRIGQFYSAFRIDAFEDPDRFKTRLQAMTERVRNQPRLDDEVPVQIPGDPEKAHHADREANGIPISEVVLKQFAEIARELDIQSLSD
ncbi:MAG: Ldh family oxidoreductase [Verrucomicrobia bacterium]|nr:Ldh family oxidoreductase [Verrucomicrobiota bacterium]